MSLPLAGRRLRGAVSIIATVALAAAIAPAHAGGPRAVNGLGQPMAWNTASPVVYNPDPGSLGLLDNTTARALLASAFAVWQAGPAAITFTEGAPLTLDVNAAGTAFSNPAHYQNFYRVHGDGRSPVIFDADGSIIDSLFGIGARFDILGVAGLDNPVGADTQITGASMIINGAFFDGIGLPDSPDDVTLEGLKATMVHEAGHFINLDHSTLNHEQALDDNAGNDLYVPSMFPIAVRDEAALATTNPDDELAAQNLYPTAAAVGTIEGSVKVGSTPFQGANVVIRKVGDPLMSAWSVISGGSFFPCNPASSCDPCSTACEPGDPPEQGEFSVHFLPSGTFTVCVEQIDTRIAESNGTFVGPLATPPIVPGPEECYDASESGTSADDPDDALAVSPDGGPLEILLDALPASDTFEPNNTLATGSTLSDLPSGRDTVGGILTSGDLDVFNVPVTAGQRVRIDLDAAEHGSGLDAVVGFYDASNNLVAYSDDAVDLDSQAFSHDSALDLIAAFTGTGKVVISSFPDLDQNGPGGSTTGGYWLRVEVTSDTDGDGVPDNDDICPTTAQDDADRDGICFGADNCPTVDNPLQDAPVKASGTMVTGGDVTYFVLSADEGSIVYLADQEENDVFQIYSVPIAGGTPVRLNPSLAGTTKDVDALLISSDSTKVVYRADQDTDGKPEIYEVPLAGGAVTKLNGTLPTGGNVFEFNISPDGTRVVYRADQDTLGVDELYSVPIAGGPSVKLSGTMTPGGTMIHPGAGFSSFLFSEDSARVVYAADQDTNEKFELYSAPIAGGVAPTKLNGLMQAAGDVGNFQTDKVGTRVLYLADQDTDGLVEFYSVPFGGGTATKISGSLAAGGAGVANFRATYDGATAVFRAAGDTAGVNELYSVAVTGGARTKLSSPLVGGGNVVAFALPVGPGDGTRLSYRADQEVDQKFEIYTVPIAGGSVIKLNASLVAGGNVTAQGGGIYGSRVLFVADQDVNDQFEIYSVPTTGGTPAELTGTMIAAGDYQSASFDADKVTILADRTADDVMELWGTRPTGGEPLRHNGTLVASGDVVDWNFTDSSNPGRIVYLADQDADEVFELYSRPYSLDTDADGVFDQCDICADDADAAQADDDLNGIGDACQTCAPGTDPDGDEVCGAADNCPNTSDPSQDDFDADGAGDICDEDDDNDGLADVVETNTGVFVDSAHTGTDPLDTDTDDDGIPDGDEVAAGTNPNLPASTSPSITFGNRNIVLGSGSSPTAVVGSDIDSDGDLDMVSADLYAGIKWHENDGNSPPGWTTRTVDALFTGAWSVAAADVDDDGDIDVLSASDDGSGTSWYENNGASPPVWTGHIISIANYDTSVFAADVDGDGDIDALAAASASNQVAWYENNGASPPVWTQRIISTSENNSRSVFGTDVDGDGDMDVLSAAAGSNRVSWFENDGATTPGWTQHTITTTAMSAFNVFAADVDRDGDIDALSASTGDGTVAWYESDGAFPPVWTKHVISASASFAASVFAADMDGDGDTDVLSASASDNTVAWYESNGATLPVFAVRKVSQASLGAFSVFAGDVDGDGDKDILSASGNDGVVAWHENRAIHRNVAFGPSQGFAMGAHPIDAQAVDINGDGLLDIVAAYANHDKVVWYEGNGSFPFGWTARNITTTVDGVEVVAAADVDRDGDPDVLASSFNDDKVSWHENGGGLVPTWTEHAITTTADGAWWVGAADLDEDGDLDVLSASLSDTTISWYENDGNVPPGWTQRTISSSTQTRRCAVADMDGDGDLDVVAPRIGPGTMAWFRNDGGSPIVWTAGTINATGIGTPGAVYAADVDSDGDMDLLSAAYSDPLMAWYENNGAASPTWSIHMIALPDTGWFPVSAADIDGDGDVDLMTGAGLATKEVLWLENDGAHPPGWTMHEQPTAGGVNSIVAADLDDDGDADLLSATRATGGPSDQVRVWQNGGGQFTLTSATFAPVPMADGTSAALLRFDLTSNGRTGDSDVELAALELLVTDASNVTLTSTEANQIIERLRIYRDTGSGLFEQRADTLIATVETLELSPQAIEFVTGDPRVRVSSGQSQRFFLVAETTAAASSQSPSFRLKLLSGSGITARDAETRTLLDMESSGDTGTGTITLVADATAPYVTGLFPPDQSVDVSLATAIVVYLSEPVDPATASSGVTLYAGGVKVPSNLIVSGPTVSIDPVSALGLGTDYQVQVTSLLRDLHGNPAVGFTATFETADSAGSTIISAAQITGSGTGATLEGSNVDDNSGFANAALGDVNDTAAAGGIADLIIGAPNADAGGADAGKATLIFGAAGLQSNSGVVESVTYLTGTAQDFIGQTVAQAGDVNGDGVRDFFIGAPHCDQAFTDAGVVYLVFGDEALDELAPATLDLDNLASCASPTLCGVKFLGAAAGDLAGASLSYVGDVDGDGHDDVAIGAPGASPEGRTAAGKVYLIYGPVQAGVIPLSQVGSTVRGVVLYGETAGDLLGAAVSPWLDETGDGFDDLLLGAPGATALDASGSPVPQAGYVYAIQGGRGQGRLDDSATPGIIQTSRVANGGSDQVAGMVFIGDKPGGELGRSITGEVDIDGNGVNDILIAGNGVVYSIPGDDPKTRTGSTLTTTTSGGGGLRTGFFNARRDFGATVYTTGNNDPLTVGPAGDLNNDGFGDFIVGSPLADTAAGVDAGLAYVILGSPAPQEEVRALAGVGVTIDGFIVEGAEAGDNLGASVGGGFDFNGDGVDDGLVGAPFADSDAGTPANAGETYIISPLRPDEVEGFSVIDLGGGVTRLEWTATDLATGYNIYRGAAGAIAAAGEVKTSNMTALACGVSLDADANQLPDYDDAAAIPSGAIWFYLVTARNLQGEGPLGPPGALPPRVNDAQCP